jgi:hypothetical protein
MNLRNEYIRMYWSHAIAIMLLLIALGRYIRIRHWEALIGSLAAACFGLARPRRRRSLRLDRLVHLVAGNV